MPSLAHALHASPLNNNLNRTQLNKEKMKCYLFLCRKWTLQSWTKYENIHKILLIFLIFANYRIIPDIHKILLFFFSFCKL